MDLTESETINFYALLAGLLHLGNVRHEYIDRYINKRSHTLVSVVHSALLNCGFDGI